VIRELLERDFLADSGRDIQETIQREVRGGEVTNESMRRLLDELGVTPAELEAAVGHLSAAVAAIESSAETPALLPHDAVASLVQSALQQMYEERLPHLIDRKEGSAAFPTEDPVTDQGLVASASSTKADRLAGRMEQTDIRWAACLVAKAITFFRRRRRFEDRPADPQRFSNTARLYVLGDWGSGVPRARTVGGLVREMLLAPDSRDREQHVVHLGDVYYSGWRREYEDNFLPYWPVKPGEEGKYGSWCLNANHDMYSGGYGYYDYLLADPRFARQQGSSYFSLENDDWQLLGIDTAWEDEDLAGSQPEWIASRLRAQQGKRKSVLMSHHQLFSAFAEGTPKVRQKVQGVLDEDLVTGWFWGHEHRCAIYEPRDRVQYARLVGHGGVPVWAATGTPPPTVRHLLQEYLRSGFEKFARFGFAVLDFEGKKIKARYFCERGPNQPAHQHYDETLG
jgi:hypothetical protein